MGNNPLFFPSNAVVERQGGVGGERRHISPLPVHSPWTIIQRERESENQDELFICAQDGGFAAARKLDHHPCVFGDDSLFQLLLKLSLKINNTG